MSLIDKIFGRPLRSSEISKEQLTWSTGVTVLGLDALSSTAYGPEAALTILVPLGALGLRYLPFINLALIVLLGLLFFSYRQTIAAYPNGGGAYIVAKENLGQHASLLAAASLLLDYVLNVAVGVSAGVAAVVSAVPILQGHVLMLCVIVLLILTVVNLRGVPESGITFGLPTFAFVVCMSLAIIIGLVRALQSGGHPQPVASPPQLPTATLCRTHWESQRQACHNTFPF